MCYWNIVTCPAAKHLLVWGSQIWNFSWSYISVDFMLWGFWTVDWMNCVCCFSPLSDDVLSKWSFALLSLIISSNCYMYSCVLWPWFHLITIAFKWRVLWQLNIVHTKFTCWLKMAVLHLFWIHLFKYMSSLTFDDLWLNCIHGYVHTGHILVKSNVFSLINSHISVIKTLHSVHMNNNLILRHNNTIIYETLKKNVSEIPLTKYFIHNILISRTFLEPRQNKHNEELV